MAVTARSAGARKLSKPEPTYSRRVELVIAHFIEKKTDVAKTHCLNLSELSHWGGQFL